MPAHQVKCEVDTWQYNDPKQSGNMYDQWQSWLYGRLSDPSSPLKAYSSSYVSKGSFLDFARNDNRNEEKKALHCACRA